MNSTNRAELAAFLRARRARLSPRQVGLPAAGAPGRRRTPGLRRQEVAQLAGMSVDYYIRLEQGRGASWPPAPRSRAEQERPGTYGAAAVLMK